MDPLIVLPAITFTATLLVLLGVAARWVTAGAADAVTVAPRVRALFQRVMSPGGGLSATELISLSAQMERELVAVDQQVADRVLRRHVESVLHDVVAVSMDAAAVRAPSAVEDLYRASGTPARARADLLRDEAGRGLRALGALESRAAFLVRLGTMVGR